jgi:hypothetical protein
MDDGHQRSAGQPPRTPEPKTPTVGPLRINKVNSSASTTSSTSTPSRTSSEEAEVHGRHASPPYPDGRFRPTPVAADAQRQATPEVTSSGLRRQLSTRTKFGATDPNRPTISGYAGTPPSSLTPGFRGDMSKLVPEVPAKERLDNNEDHGLFQKSGLKPAVPVGDEGIAQSTYQQYYPPPGVASLQPPTSAGVNRLSSTASTSTTRAQRGSPPPPETPVLGRPMDTFESAYPYAQSAAASRVNQYANPVTHPSTVSPSQQQLDMNFPRPWTPTEQPGSYPHGPPVAFQGETEVPSTTIYQSPAVMAYQSPPQQSQSRAHQLSPTQPIQQFGTPPTQPFLGPAAHISSPTQPVQYLQSPQANQPGSRMSFSPQTHPLEQDLQQRLQVADEPPPAYSSVSQQRLFSGTSTQALSTEKRLSNASVPSVASSQDANLRRHPAFANETGQPLVQQPVVATPTTSLAPIQITSPIPGPSTMPASPPPLPEGWIAHMDQNSGQYYYIHLPTQSTQWEFPKGPTPLNLQEPLSPTGTFMNPMASPALSSFHKPLASPGFPQTVSFHRDSMLSANTLASPTVAGFTGPPPSAGVDMYKVLPTNGVYFGPYLRYTNIDLERGLWLGSILLVTDVPQPPTIHIHQSNDLSPNRKSGRRFHVASQY